MTDDFLPPWELRFKDGMNCDDFPDDEYGLPPEEWGEENPFNEEEI